MRFTKLSVLAFSTFLCCGSLVLAASEQTTTGSQSGATEPGGTSAPGIKKVVPPVQPLASITLSCSNGKTYKISTGTRTGECHVGTGAASCSIGTTEVAYASCHDGCESTSGSGSCSVVN